MIINKDNNNSNLTYISRLEKLLPLSVNYYYFNVNNVHNLQEVILLKDQLNPETKILLEGVMEGYETLIKYIYQTLICEQGIDESKFQVLSGAYDVKQLVEKYAKHFNKKLIKSEWVSEFEFLMSTQLYHKIFFNRQIYDRRVDTEFFKSYICLNRRWRLHRPVIVGMLKKYNLLNRGFVSFADAEVNPSWDEVKNSILSTHKDNSEIFDYFSNYFDEFKNLYPLTIDHSSLQDMGLWALTDTLDWQYANSYFSLVTETNFHSDPDKYNSYYVSICEPTRFYSEKTFKPMVFKHPFVLASVPYMLQGLREIGYKTFHPYINEDYDTELDDNKRLLKIIHEVKRLSYLQPKELQEFLDKTQEIVDHNYERLSSVYKNWLLNK